MTTAIEWTDETWNPTTGCDRVSPGCDHCYIERTIPFRMEGRHFDEKGKMGVRLHPDRLDKPLHWRKPRRVFVNSLSDLFHPDVPSYFINFVWVTMRKCPQHTFQILTKRPQRMREKLEGTEYCVAENVWLGTSIESDRYVFRADHLRATPAAVRFLSLEPLLGPLPSLDLTGIDWVIVGGESGPGARPVHPDWVRDIRDRCVAAGVPFFFKQWGAWVDLSAADDPDGQKGCDGHQVVEVPLSGGGPSSDGQPVTGRHRPDVPSYPEYQGDGAWIMARVGKKAAGRVLDGRTWDEMPKARVA